MNLQEVLNYRSHCLLCNRKLEIKSLDLAGVSLIRTNDGLHAELVSKDKNYSVYFKNDGTYERMKRWNNMYVKPLAVLRECPKCIPKVDLVEDVTVTGIPKSPPPILLKARSTGMTTISKALSQYLVATTLDSLKDLRCAYTFELFGDSQGNFESTLNWEDIRFCTKTDFYHIKTNFKEGKTWIKSGNFKKDTIETIVSMDVPAVNASNIVSKEKLVEKIRLYNLFS